MTRHSNLRLDHQLCFALYTATNAVTRAYREPLERHGLTYTQYLVMLVLWEDDHLTVGKISKRLNLDPATLTPLLKKMEAAGHIVRTRNNLDERIVDITLTDAGKQLQKEIAPIQREVECKTGFNAEEFMQLKETLRQLVNNMESKSGLKNVA